jgi:hypothetical protein
MEYPLVRLLYLLAVMSALTLRLLLKDSKTSP